MGSGLITRAVGPGLLANHPPATPGRPPVLKSGIQLSVSKTGQLAFKRIIDDLAASHRLKIQPDEKSSAWIQQADWELVQRVARLGILSMVCTIFEKRQAEETEPQEASVDDVLTLTEFCRWYLKQRRADCQSSTTKKIKASLNQLCLYCRENESVAGVQDLDAEMAFRYQLHRRQTKAEATVSKDIKIAKTAFKYGLNAGKLTINPFADLSAGKDVNPDGHCIIPISDHDLLVEACPDSDWRTILALARLAGLRCPSELTHLKWEDVNWGARRIRITSPKTKHLEKPERTIPMFERLETALRDHWELTGSKSEYVITSRNLRKSGASLSSRFSSIRERSGVAGFPKPFRNMRLSAVNDVCRIPGITPKTIARWFGHDIKTALKHYNRVTKQDFDRALAVDPFTD